mmetsp:Transcript_38822/g.94970  ORF Transcript_38822/g.94970 Transcript_38822/m.94970 type:complete len:214 (+) Transcript_38822:32-673(+)
MALYRHGCRASPGDYCHLPVPAAPGPHRPRLQPRLQRLGALAVRRVPHQHPTRLSRRPHSALPLPLPQHRLQNPPVRVPPPHLPRRHWSPRQDRRPKRHQLSPHHRNHSPLPPHHGDRLRALQDRRHLYHSKDTPRRARIGAHLSHGRALLRSLHRSQQYGLRPRPQPVRPPPQAHYTLLSPPQRQPARQGGAPPLLAGTPARGQLFQLARRG